MSSKPGDKSAKSQLKPKAKPEPSVKVVTPIKDKRKTDYTRQWADPVVLSVGNNSARKSDSKKADTGRRSESKKEDGKKHSAREKSKASDKD